MAVIQKAVMRPAALVRIGEAARELGVTTRTLRYWEEMGLISPAAHSGGGERLYTAAEVERISHIRELQKVVGLSLADIRAVLDTEQRLDDIRSAYHSDASAGSRRQLTAQAIVATEGLLSRIDERLMRLEGFRDQLAANLARMKEHVAALEGEKSPAPDAGSPAPDEVSP